MISTIPPSNNYGIPYYRSEFTGQALPGRLATLIQIPALLTPCIAFAAENGTASEPESPLILLILFGTSTIAISVFLIVGLTRWGKKQDQIQSMMPFCIRYLAKSKNEIEKISAAKVLGRSKHPAALLILIDIVNDEKVGEGLHNAAVEALREMSRNYRKYTHLIDESLTAVEAKTHQKTIDLLIRYFENGKKRHVQSAYVIGREYLRIENYSEARTWLQKAKNRNMKAQVYVNQISQLITTCTQHLFDAGDALYKAGKYHDALERYALASHDIGFADKQRFSAHLRLACIYCKLEHYEDAYQETLLALQDHHKTDTSLTLNKLLHGRLSESARTPEAKERRDKLAAEIASLVDKAMVELI